ncbi:MAG: LysE family translocator [Bacillota bacterium]
METLFTGIIMGFLLAAPIGPVNIETIKRGFNAGLWPAIVFGSGALLGDLFYCILLLIGLVPFLAAIPDLERILWGGGAIIMVYLGWGGIKDFWQHKEINLEEDSPKAGTGMIRGFSLGIAMAVINPYALMWYITAGGAYVSTGLAKGGLLGGIASVGSFLFGVSLWLALLIFGIHKAKRLITPTTMRIISGVSGIALWGFAAWFALNFWGM